MAKHYTVRIQNNRIINSGIFSNQNQKKTLSQIYSMFTAKYPDKEIYVVNAGFFNMTSDFTPCFGLKAENVVYSDNWNIPYVAIDHNRFQFISDGSIPDQYSNAVSGYPVLVENFKKSPHFSHCIDNSNRGRTLVGFTDEDIILSCIADVSDTTDFTLDEELDFALSLKCKYAINLDGGGSSQCNFAGKTITSSRKVNNFIYVVADPQNTEQTVTTTSTLKVGDSVKLKSGAKYFSGKKIPIWVIKSQLWCRGINKNGSVIISTKRIGPITGVVSITELILTNSSISINS